MKMINVLIVLIVITTTLISGCNEQTTPTNSFEHASNPCNVTIQADVIEGEAPLTVNFTSINCGKEEILAYQWFFQDPLQGESTEAEPTYTFYGKGVEEVLLVVKCTNDTSAGGEILINVTVPDPEVIKDTSYEVSYSLLDQSSSFLMVIGVIQSIAKVHIDTVRLNVTLYDDENSEITYQETHATPSYIDPDEKAVFFTAFEDYEGFDHYEITIESFLQFNREPYYDLEIISSSADFIDNDYIVSGSIKNTGTEDIHLDINVPCYDSIGNLLYIASDEFNTFAPGKERSFSAKVDDVLFDSSNIDNYEIILSPS